LSGQNPSVCGAFEVEHSYLCQSSFQVGAAVKAINKKSGTGLGCRVPAPTSATDCVANNHVALIFRPLLGCKWGNQSIA